MRRKCDARRALVFVCVCSMCGVYLKIVKYYVRCACELARCETQTRSVAGPKCAHVIFPFGIIVAVLHHTSFVIVVPPLPRSRGHALRSGNTRCTPRSHSVCQSCSHSSAPNAHPPLFAAATAAAKNRIFVLLARCIRCT